MTMLERIAERERGHDINAHVSDFARIAKYIMQQRGFSNAAALAATDSRSGNLGPKLAAIIERGSARAGITRENLFLQRSAVTATGLSPFADYSAISAGFLASLANASVFSAMLPSMTPVPLGTGTVGAVLIGAQAYALSEGDAKPLTRLSVTNSLMLPNKAAAVLTLTQELVRTPVVGSNQFIARELQQAVALATDQKFLSILTAGVSAVAPVGITADSVRIMLATMLAQITTGQNSRLFLIVRPEICKAWAVLSANGASAFPNLTPTGGEIQGMTVLVSDGLLGGQVVMADASMILAASGEVGLQDVSEGTLVADSVPNSPPTSGDVVTSLWQMNLAGIMVERYFCAVRPRTDSVALASNVSNSPN